MTQDLGDFMWSINGRTGVIAMLITILVTQVLIFLFEKNVINLNGPAKIVLVNLLTILSGVLSLTIGGMSIGAALVHSQTLVMVQVFFNQVWKQFRGDSV